MPFYVINRRSISYIESEVLAVSALVIARSIQATIQATIHLTYNTVIHRVLAF